MQIKKRGALTSVIIVLVLLFIMAPIGWKAMTAFMKSSLNRDMDTDDYEIRSAFLNLAREIRDVVNDSNSVTISDHRVPIKLTFLKNKDVYQVKNGYAIFAFDKSWISLFIVENKRDNFVVPDVYKLTRPVNCTSTCLCLVKTKEDRYWIHPSKNENNYDSIYDFNSALCENFGDNVKFYSLYEDFKVDNDRRGTYSPYILSTNLGYQYLQGARTEYRYPNIPFLGISNKLETTNTKQSLEFTREKSYAAIPGDPVEHYTETYRMNVSINRMYGYPFFSDQFVYTVNHDLDLKNPNNPIASFYFDKINLGKMRLTKSDNTVAIFLTPNNVFSNNSAEESFIDSRRMVLSQFIKKEPNSMSVSILREKRNDDKIFYFMQYLRYAFNPMLFSPDEAAKNIKFLGTESIKSVIQSIDNRVSSCNGLDKEECLKQYSTCEFSPNQRECRILLMFENDYLEQQCKSYKNEYIAMFKETIGEDRFNELFNKDINCYELFLPVNMQKFLSEIINKSDKDENLTRLVSLLLQIEGTGNYLNSFNEIQKYFDQNKNNVVSDDGTVSAEYDGEDLHKIYDALTVIASDEDLNLESKKLDDGTIIYKLSTLYNTYALVAKKNPSDSYIKLNLDYIDLDLVKSEDDLASLGDVIELSKLSSYIKESPDQVYSSIAVLMKLQQLNCITFPKNVWPIKFSQNFAMECAMQ